MDKEFLAELEKNLGLAEATNNLMPPSPMPVEVQQVQQVQQQAHGENHVFPMALMFA